MYDASVLERLTGFLELEFSFPRRAGLRHQLSQWFPQAALLAFAIGRIAQWKPPPTGGSLKGAPSAFNSLAFGADAEFRKEKGDGVPLDVSAE
jgi:hypothetical protein